MTIRGLLLPFILAACSHQRTARVNEQFKMHLSIAQKTIRGELTLKELLKKGPYQVSPVISQTISGIQTCLVAAKTTDQAPLIIIQHGNKADYRAHQKQAEHLASWGLHTLLISQPNEKQWIQNGKNLAKLISIIKKERTVAGVTFDHRSIILAGHSFGGTAIAVAAGLTNVAKGLVFLDPAVFRPSVKKYLSRINEPSIILGADPNVFLSKKRGWFYREPSGEVLEVSLKDATHEDAQWPSLTKINYFFDPFTDTARQAYYTAALTMSALSLTTKDSIQIAQGYFGKMIKAEKGKLYGLRSRSRSIKKPLKRK